MVRSQGLEVDDDNEPAPENIPAKGEIPLPTYDKSLPLAVMGWDGIDQREVVIQTKRMHHSRMIGHLLENLTLKFFEALSHHVAA